MNIISRAQWGARAPKSSPTHVSPSVRAYFVVHHSGAPASQTVRAIQDWCMDGRGFSDIDYNHLVRGTTGEIYEGRGWDVVGAHTTGYNTSGVGVCVIGNDELSDAAKASVRWLYEQYNKRCGRTLAIRGHRQLATTGTDCPGNRAYTWVQAGMPAPDNVEDDMALTSADGKTMWGTDIIPNPAFRPDAKTNNTTTAFFAVGDIWNRVGSLQLAVAEIAAQVKTLSGQDFIDEAAVIHGVLSGLSPEKIAEAIPSDLAEQVVDLLAARIAA